MRLGTKTLIAGVVIGAFTFGAGVANTSRLRHEYAKLRDACEAPEKAERAKVNAAAADAKDLNDRLPNLTDAELAALAKRFNVNIFDLIEIQEGRKKQLAQGKSDFSGLPVPPWDLPADSTSPTADSPKLICTGQKLVDIPGHLVGEQAEIAHAYTAAKAWKTWTTPVASIVAGIGALPWIWYFLLRRVAELRSAISGNAPYR